MATYNKIQDFVEQILKAKHDFSSHTFKFLLTNSAPSASNTIKADLTEITAANGYSAGGLTADGVTLSEASGTAKLVITDEVLTAAGGSIGPFRYIVLYNDSTTSPADALICWWDYGSSITLADGESFTIDADATNGIFQLA